MAVVDGEPVTMADLLPMLTEAAGGAALQEAVLDRRLEAAMAAAGADFAVIEREAIERERGIFIGVLEQARRSAGLTDPMTRDEAERLLADVRRDRGLGEGRFAALLRRSAMLRRLAAPGVRVEPSAVETLYRIRYGERRTCRVITSSLLDRVAAVRQAMLNPPPEDQGLPLAARFARAAALMAGEPGPRVGPGPRRPNATETFSTLDTAYAAAIRQAAAALSVGDMSTVVAVDGGFGLVVLEGIEPANGPPIESVRAELEGDLRSRLERVSMDAIVADLLSRPGVTVLDRSLSASYQGLSKSSLPR
ncbi:MAG: hypothetical protein ACT4PL_03710 [Phycisphaerales bacterium]